MAINNYFEVLCDEKIAEDTYEYTKLGVPERCIRVWLERQGQNAIKYRLSVDLNKVYPRQRYSISQKVRKEPVYTGLVRPPESFIWIMPQLREVSFPVFEITPRERTNINLRRINTGRFSGTEDRPRPQFRSAGWVLSEEGEQQ